MNTIITPEKVLSWEPCHEYKQKRRLLEISGGRDSITPLEAFDLPLPPGHLLWLLLRPEIIPQKEIHLLACTFATAAVEIYERRYPKDKRPRQAVEAKRALVESPSHENWKKLEDARWTAWEAANDASWHAEFAARATIRENILEVAGRAASAAGRDASSTARWTEESDGAFDTARKTQIGEVRKVLERLANA